MRSLDGGQSLRRPGFSLVELLVVVGIIVVLVALLVPAVQSARESARRTSCIGNSRQIALAMVGFESANGFFAPANSTGAGAMYPPNNPKEHGMFALILPFLEEGALFKTLGYDFNQNWDSAVNRPAARTIVPILACSSAPDGARTVTTARYPTNTYSSSWGASGPACNDYSTIVEVETVFYTALGLAFPPLPKRVGMLPTNSRTTGGNIRDGLSSTLAIVECGNRPRRFFNGSQMGVRGSGAASPCNVNNDSLAAGWADNSATFTLHGADKATGVPNSSCYQTDAAGRVPASGVTSGGQCVMNCSNWDEPYSFHPGGMNVVMGDGSARFLAETIDPQTMISIITRAGSDIPGDF